MTEFRVVRRRCRRPARRTRIPRRAPGRHERRDRRCAGALDDQLRPLEEEDKRLGYLLVVDHDELVHELGDDRARELAGMLDGDPVGDGRARRLVAREGSAGRRRHADDA